MPPTLEDVSAQALQLSQADRLALAAQLLADAESADDFVSEADVAQAWSAEVQARVLYDREHGLPSISHDELMDSLRRR